MKPLEVDSSASGVNILALGRIHPYIMSFTVIRGN